MQRKIVGAEISAEERLNEGGFLVLRRLRLKLRRDDGTLTTEGRYDFIERPMGRDAVVVAVWRRGVGGVEVLVRAGIRVPLWFAEKDAASRAPVLLDELVAGIIERGEDDEAAWRARAAAEVHEEAGITVEAARVVVLGAPLYATPGLCTEKFVFAAVEVRADERAVIPEGDGSPFEEGARLSWRPIEDAVRACVRGEIEDVKTELCLRRLADYLATK